MEQIAMPMQRILDLTKIVVLSSLGWLLTEEPAVSETGSLKPNVTTLSFVKNNSQEFSPIRGETYRFAVNVPEPARSISLAIYTSDGDLLRTITQPGNNDAGLHTLTWDGKDDNGKVVPDEAYVPAVTVEFENGEKQTLDPRSYSGGELVDKVPVEITPDQAISYQLPAPCRVLIRAGIKGGPMLRNLTSWQPKSAGKNTLRWDGKDQSGLFDIRNEQNLGVLLIAFKLPEHSVLTYGNQAVDYRAYRMAKHWRDTVPPPKKCN